MKKCYLCLVSFVCLSLCFTACSSDDDDDDFTGLPDSPLTQEEIKDLIQKEANDFLAEIQGLSENEGLKVLYYFSEIFDILDNDYLYPYVEANKVSQPTIKSVVERLIPIKEYYYTYTWDDEEADWITTENGNQQLEFIFPSSDSKSSNDAKIVVTATASNVTTVIDNEEYELPKNAKAVVTVNGNTVATITASTDWISDTELPKYGKANLDLIDYNVTFDITKGSPNKSTALLKKKGGKTLIDAYADIDTDLDKAVKDEVLDKGKANATIKLTDVLVLSGDMDVKTHKDTIDKLTGNYATGHANSFNNNSNIVLVSRKDDTKLATLKARAKDGEMIFVLKFSDNTEVDADVYFGEGFDSFIKNWNKFLNSF